MRTRDTRLGVFGVIGEDGRLLLAHQRKSGRWTLPGGGVHFGEPPGEALIREVAEEAGARVTRAALLGVHDNVYDPGDGVLRHGVRLLYRTEVVGVPTPRSPLEVDELRFFSIDDLPAEVTEWAALGAEMLR